MMRALPDSGRRQRGIAAVELALVLPVFVLLLAATVFVGRTLYHYQVMQKAAHDATRYLASAPPLEVSSSSRMGGTVAAARAIADAEIADLPATSEPPVVSVMCNGGGTCTGYSVPVTVAVRVESLLSDDLVPVNAYGLNGVDLTAQATMRYVGN
jgi:Flp pilus assembly protein TadG